MAHDVFISYSSQDKSVADAVCATLERRKIRCWIAPRDILPSATYAESLIDAINNSRLMVVVFSANSNKSQQVMREIERAVHKGMPILPLRIEDVTPSKAMEYYLSSPHWLDALTQPMEQHLQKLADTVEMILGTQGPSVSSGEPAPSFRKTAPQKSKKKLYVSAALVLVVLVVVGVIVAMNMNGGNNGVPISGSPTGIPGTSTQIDSNASPLGGTSGILTGGGATALSGSSSPIVPNPAGTVVPSANSSPTSLLTTTSGIINTSGQLVSGASTLGILKQGETQFFTFIVGANDAVYAVLSEGETDSQMQPWLELLGPDGTKLTGGTSLTTYTIDYGLTNAGKYTLRVRDYANLGGKYVLSFMLLSQPVGPLTSGVSLQGQLKVPGDVNWYTFDANAGDAMYATLNEGASSPNMQPWLELLSPDGARLTGSTGLTTYTIDYGLTKAGKYTLRVRDYANIGGNFVLSFMQASKAVNHLTSGISLQSELKVPGDVNWYTFDAAANDAVYAVLSEGVTESQMQPWLELLSPDGARLTGSTGLTTYTIDYRFTKAGKYTLRVRDYANLGGKYVLSFMLLSQPVGPLASGVSLQGQLKVPGDVNWYTFDANAGDAMYATLSEGANSPNMQPWLELLSPDGARLTGSTGLTTYTIDYGLTKAGKYTLRVRDYANIGGNYVLSFQLVR